MFVTKFPSKSFKWVYLRIYWLLEGDYIDAFDLLLNLEF